MTLPPDPTWRTRSVILDLDDEDLDTLTELADDAGLTFSEFVSRLVSQQLDALVPKVEPPFVIS